MICCENIVDVSSLILTIILLVKMFLKHFKKLASQVLEIEI